MQRRTLLKSIIGAAFFAAVSGLTACSEKTINRAISLLTGIPAIVRSFLLSASVEARILQGITEAKDALVLFKDNPTRSNLRNALAVMESLVSHHVFDTGNPNFDRRLGPAIAAVIFVLNFINPIPDTPAGALSVGADANPNAKVTISDEQEKVIEARLKAAEAALKGN